MTRTLYDSTTAGDIPKSATMVGGYVDGRYRTVDALRARFPKATLVTITVLGAPGAHVCDTEPGNIGPAGAVAWAKAEVKAGRKPTLYCMASQWPQIKALASKAGIGGKVSYWIADYDNDPTLPKGAVAKQYADPAVHGKGHFDLSVVADHWPGVDPDPQPVGKSLTRWQRTLLRRVLRLLVRADPLGTEDRKTVTALVAAGEGALKRRKP